MEPARNIDAGIGGVKVDRPFAGWDESGSPAR